MTNLVQFPGLGLSFELSRVAFSIGDMDIYWYGVCIAFGLCLALVFAFRRCTEFGIDADSMVDVILIGVVLGIASARLYYVAMAPYNYDTIWDVLAVRDGGLAIYGGIIGAFVFGGLACKWRGVPVLPMFDLAGMGFLIGQGCGRWGNFFNQEAFGCNTTLPGYVQRSNGRLPDGQHCHGAEGRHHRPRHARPPHLPLREHLVLRRSGPAGGVHQKAEVQRRHCPALPCLVRRRPLLDRALRTDSLLLVPSLGLRASQLVAAAAVVGGVALEIFLTRKYKSKPLMVTLALTAENRSLLAKVRKAEPEFTVEREELVASSPRKLFLERTNAYNERVKQQLKEKLAEKN